MRTNWICLFSHFWSRNRSRKWNKDNRNSIELRALQFLDLANCLNPWWFRKEIFAWVHHIRLRSKQSNNPTNRWNKHWKLQFGDWSRDEPWQQRDKDRDIFCSQYHQWRDGNNEKVLKWWDHDLFHCRSDQLWNRPHRRTEDRAILGCKHDCWLPVRVCFHETASGTQRIRKITVKCSYISRYRSRQCSHFELIW